MKKLFASALAIASLVACSKDELVNQQGPVAISFKQAYVENVTRATDPSTTTDNIASFDVWGFMDQPSGTIFEGQDVTKSGNEWTYSPLQYWTPGHTYYFGALSPMNSANWDLDTTGASTDGVGVVSFTNVDGTEDLIYAATSVTTSNDINNQPESVKLAFNHLLSKVKFSFTNGFPAENYTINVKNIKMTVPAAGSIDLAVENWWDNDDWTLENGTTTLEFGNMETENLAISKIASSEKELLTIPAGDEQEYTVTFDVELYAGDVLAFSNSLATNISGAALEMGKAYNFRAELNANNIADTALTPIEFDVEMVKDWVIEDDIETNIVAEVATATEFASAISNGLDVVLTQNINLDELVQRASIEAGIKIYNDVTIDGNGFSISTSAIRGIQIIDAQNVTIKDLTLNAPKSERGIQLQGNGNLTISNVTAVSANYTVNLPGSSANSTVTIKDSNLKGLNVVNIWGENAVVNIENTTISCEDNVAEGYGLISNNGVNAKVSVKGGEMNLTGTSTSGSYAGMITATGADITFDGTKGDCTVMGHLYAIKYGEYAYTFATFEKALEKALDGETIIMLQDVTTTSHLNITKSVNLDFNGKTLTVDIQGSVGDDAIWVRDNAEVVITGNGAINFINTSASTVYASGIFATGSSKVTIENGTFVAAAEAVYAQANASVEILGGSFKSTEHPEYTLNLKDSARNTASIVVKGGKFYQFNPANNAAEGAGTNFVADGKTVSQDGDWYVVE